MKKRTSDSDGSDDIEAAFKVFDTKNDGYTKPRKLNKTQYFRLRLYDSDFNALSAL